MQNIENIENIENTENTEDTEDTEKELYCYPHCNELIDKEALLKTEPEIRTVEKNKSKTKNKYFPSFLQAIGVTLFEFIFITIIYVLSEEISPLLFTPETLKKYSIPISALGDFLYTIFSLFVFYAFAKKYYKNVFTGMFQKKFNYHFLYSMLPIFIGVAFINIFLSNWIPNEVSPEYDKFIKNIAQSGKYFVLFFITTSFIAPICEELVFRGIILRGFAFIYKPLSTILLSSLLFSLVHINIAQIPNAFVLGLIFAILTLHTKNISYAMCYHILNNSLAMLILPFADESSNDSTDIPLIGSIIFGVLGVIFVYLGLKWTIKILTSEKRSLIPSKELIDDYLEVFKPNLKNKAL